MGIPLTHTKKENQYYHHFEFQKEQSVAIISQARLFDAKRLMYRMGRVSKGDHKEIKQKITQLLA